MNGQYISEQFKNFVWPIFSMRLTQKCSETRYWNTICEITDFAKKDFVEITANEVEDYFNALNMGDITSSAGKEYAYSTAYEKFKICRAVGAYIMENAGNSGYPYPGYVSPFVRLKYQEPDSDITIDKIPSEEEVDELLEKSKGTYIHYIIGLAYYGGLTASELDKITKRSISSEGLSHLSVEIRFGPHKSKVRHVVLPEAFSAELRDYILTLPDDQNYLFINKRKTPVAPRDMQRSLVKLGSRWTLSELRNAAGCKVLKETGSYTELSDRLGISYRWVDKYKPAAEQM